MRERKDPMSFLDKIFGSYSDRELKKIKTVVDRIVGMESEYFPTEQVRP